MPANTIPIFPGVVRSQLTVILPADGTNLKVIFTAGENGSRVDSIWVWNNTSQSVTLLLYQSDGTADYLLGNVSVSANSGSEILSYLLPDVLDRCDAKYLASNQSLKINLSSAITSGSITIVVDGGDY